MQKTVYYCDQCTTVIGDQPHVSLGLSLQYSGVAFPPGTVFKKDQVPSDRWVVRKAKSGFMHFHIKCVGPYFTAIKDAAIEKPGRQAKK